MANYSQEVHEFKQVQKVLNILHLSFELLLKLFFHHFKSLQLYHLGILEQYHNLGNLHDLYSSNEVEGHLLELMLLSSRLSSHPA